jgi:hypothetical protein
MCGGALALLSGCVLEKRDDGAEFREAVPHQEAVVVAGPESAAEGESRSASITDTRRAQASEPWARGEYAFWYGFTRHVRGGVNLVTAAVLGNVWALVHSPPSSVGDEEAVWGPYTDALEPVTYRFRVTRVAEAEYDYVLEGRPKTSEDDGDYRAILSGRGYGQSHEQHGQGEFTVDVDVARELDPFSGDPKDSGTLRVQHYLPADVTTGGDALPRTIIAEARPSASEEWFTVTSNAAEDGSGTLHVDALGDVDDTKLTALEDIVIDSQWRSDGAGRADIVLAGGDVPAGLGSVTAVECWGADFMRSYYSDSVELSPAFGDPTACAFDSAPAK